jgi:hypothetical protein
MTFYLRVCSRVWARPNSDGTPDRFNPKMERRNYNQDSELALWCIQNHFFPQINAGQRSVKFHRGAVFYMWINAEHVDSACLMSIKTGREQSDSIVTSSLPFSHGISVAESFPSKGGIAFLQMSESRSTTRQLIIQTNRIIAVTDFVRQNRVDANKDKSAAYHWRHPVWRPAPL